MKNVKNNTHGFTLVELLAVIVVLAIVMVIALSAVLPQMQEARQNIFAIEANGAIDSAQTYLMNNSLSGKKDDTLPISGTACVTIATLRKEGVSELGDEYSGRVLVKKVGNIYIYSVSLTNGKFMVINQGFSVSSGEATGNKSVDGSDVVDYVEATFSSHTTCPTDTTITFPTKTGQ